MDKPGESPSGCSDALVILIAILAVLAFLVFLAGASMGMEITATLRTY